MSSGGRKWGTYQLIYIADGPFKLIFSKEACQSMGIIKEDFPAIGSNADINYLSYRGGGGGVKGALAQAHAVGHLSPPPGEDREELLIPCSQWSDGTCNCPMRDTALYKAATPTYAG